MLSTITQKLYADTPDRLLYHYTGYQALLSISKSSELWATDAHYFNDSSELSYAVSIFQAALASNLDQPNWPAELTQQLDKWLRQRLSNGHMLFVACFSEDGNLLSQWRGYTPHGNGISLGFDPNFLVACAAAQNFRLARCLYQREAQMEVARQSIEAVLVFSNANGPVSTCHPSESYFSRFYEQEVDLLSIAAILKNPAFEAEREWRAVSAVSPNYVENPAQYRAGRTTLIPYKPFRLRVDSQSSMQVERVYLGPTPENNLAMNALSSFLGASGISPRDGVYASQLPYRET